MQLTSLYSLKVPRGGHAFSDARLHDSAELKLQQCDLIVHPQAMLLRLRLQSCHCEPLGKAIMGLLS